MNDALLGLRIEPYAGLEGAALVRKLTTFVALSAVLASSVGCASFDRSQVRAEEQLLVTGGFSLELADTSAKRSRLASLPKLQVVEQTGANGEKSYVFADPESCCCLFVGGPEEYARYQALRARVLRERSRDVEVALFGDSAMYAHVPPDYPQLLPLPAAAEGSGCRE